MRRRARSPPSPGTRECSPCARTASSRSAPDLPVSRRSSVSLPSFDFSEVLSQMVALKASDVHITAGFPPAIRDRGKIRPMDGFPVLSGQVTREIVYSILNDDQRKRFEIQHQLDFAYAIPGVARFR